MTTDTATRHELDPELLRNLPELPTGRRERRQVAGTLRRLLAAMPAGAESGGRAELDAAMRDYLAALADDLDTPPPAVRSLS